MLNNFKFDIDAMLPEEEDKVLQAAATVGSFTLAAITKGIMLGLCAARRAASEPSTEDEWLTASQSRSKLGVSAQTLRNWGREERIKMKRLKGSNRFLYLKDDILRLTKEPNG